MSEPTLEDIKNYIKVDKAENDTEEDALIKSLQKSAEELLLNAGVKKDYEKELYKTVIQMIVAEWYENRRATGKLSLMLIGLVKQLEHSCGGDTS